MLPGVLQSGGEVVEGVPARDAVEERHDGRRQRATRKLLGNKKNWLIYRWKSFFEEVKEVDKKTPFFQ